MPIMVQISELSLSDSDEKKVFSDLHFRLNRGEWACITGQKGSGKSQILELLTGQIRPDKGQILVDDRNILRISKEKLRLVKQRLGVAIDPEIFANKRRSLTNTIAFKLRALNTNPDEVQDRVAKLLELVGISDKAESNVEELSSCERQLFGLAIALSHEPVLLLLDDPLSEISNKKEWEKYLGALERIHLRKRLTTLMMTTKNDPIFDRYPIKRHDLVGGRIDVREVEAKETAAVPEPTVVGGER
jgi:ABC-type ATPase involved in cell division